MSIVLNCLVLLSVLGAGPVPSTDYDRINRMIVKEPAYTAAPKYALLLFGPEARLRVWVVLDGEVVYLDRDGDGDLTEAGERFARRDDCKGIEIAYPESQTHYLITSLGHHAEGDPPRPHVMANVDIKGPFAYSQYCDARMGDSPRDAALAHFHGPLTIGPQTINWKLPPGLALTSGAEPNDLRAVIGTMSAEHGLWTVMRTHVLDTSAFAEGVTPFAEVEFPPKSPGGPPVKRRYPLDAFC